MPTESHFIQLVRDRYSVRDYDPGRSVGDEDLSSMIEAARLAPSAGNSQPWRFVVVRDAHLRARLCSEALGGFINRFAVDAPVIVVLCADLKIHYTRVAERVKNLSYHQIDAAIAEEHLVLQAAERGVGTCWIGWFRANRVKQILDLPRRFKVVSLITVGYARSGRATPPKKRLDQAAIVRYERWGT